MIENEYGEHVFESNKLACGSRLSSASEGRISLTQVWEHVTRTKSLPDGLDLELFFTIIHDRLRNPEWEVRQHALRVLRDFLTILDIPTMDEKMENILEDLVINLAHVSPAVRKAAVDSLRIYLKRSNHSDKILENLIEGGVKDSVANNINMNVTFGIILAVPFLIFPKTSKDTLSFVIHQLFQKTVQVTHQEVALRALVRVKYIIGEHKFKKILHAYENDNVKNNFEKLCQVYDLRPQIREETVTKRENDELREDYNRNVTIEGRRNSEIEVEVIEDKVIMETEIKLNSGSAITMQIHEESRHSSCAEITDSEEEARHGAGIVKVFTDDSEQEEYAPVPRTPRRVRFGGEIVKLRTPDSDSNNANEDATTSAVNTSTKPKKTDSLSEKPKFSQIPISVRKRSASFSEPNSPLRVVNRNKTEVTYRSSPDLRRGPQILTISKIPLRNDCQKKIKITINEYTETPPKKKVESGVDESEKSEENIEAKMKRKKDHLLTSPQPRSRRNSRGEDEFSPTPVHNEIEMLYNLTRSPERQKKNKKVNPIKSSNEENVRDKEKTVEDEKKEVLKNVNAAQTSLVLPEKKSNESDKKESPKVVYNSFQVYKEKSDEEVELKEVSKQDIKPSQSVTSDEIGIISEAVLADLQCKDHVKIRLRGLENLMKELKKPCVLTSVEPKLSHLLSILFSAELQPFLRLPAQEALSYIFLEISTESLENKLNLIALNLSKMGVPDGVRLAILLAKRIRPGDFVEQILSETVLNAKSSKTREGGLQILMAICRMFPSTDINISKAAKTVAPLLKDKKRRVRQAALEVLATLAQVSSTRLILDAASGVYTESSEKEQLLKVVRSRLSRKPLPTVELNGFVQYTTPTCEPELDWLSIDGEATHLPRLVGTPCKLLKRVQSSSARFGDIGEDQRNKKVNFWKQNSRHNILEVKENACAKKDESTNVTNTQVWAIDPVTFGASKEIAVANGTLRPVFVLQPNLPPAKTLSASRTTATNTEVPLRERGRSFSPPKSKSSESCDSSEKICSRLEPRRRSFRQESFRKSFSSDNLNNNTRFLQSHYLSSSCSSTSTASSTRSGTFSLRSGIPLPLSSEKIRFKTRHLEPTRGPLAAEPISRSKLPSSHESPDKLKVPARPLLTSETFSSGSESSGYFTPPAEPHLQVMAQSSSEETSSEPQPPIRPRFIQLDTSTEEQESRACEEEENLQKSCSASATSRSSSATLRVTESPVEMESSFILQDEVEETHAADEGSKIQREYTTNSLDEVDFTVKRPITEDRPLAKSEANLQKSSEEQRKCISSAPPLNDFINPAPLYQTFNETTINITLPGSIEAIIQNEIETKEEQKPRTSPEKPERPPFSRSSSKSLPRRCGKKYQPETPTYPDDLPPYPKPKEALSETLLHLESSEWETIMKGLRGLVRLKRHHHEYLEYQMHSVVIALAKQIRNLRSQVARAACKAAVEMFSGFSVKKSLEMELEELAAPLLQRTADTNKFLRSDANAALDVMCLALPPTKVVSVITARGCAHPNALVRATSARLLCNLTQRLGPEKVFQMPKETRDKILQVGANLLTDGNLDTRKHAKMMLSNLCNHAQFQRTMNEVVPTSTLRHIEKTLKTLK